MSLESWVKLNIGGKIFVTTRTTLSKDENSFFYKMFSQNENYLLPAKVDENGCYLIDRYFLNLFRASNCNNVVLKKRKIF